MSRALRDWSRVTPGARVALAAAAGGGLRKCGAHWLYERRGRRRLFTSEIVQLLARHGLLQVAGERAIATMEPAE